MQVRRRQVLFNPKQEGLPCLERLVPVPGGCLRILFWRSTNGGWRLLDSICGSKNPFASLITAKMGCDWRWFMQRNKQV